MASLIAQFAGNPLATPVGQKIEQATDPALASENWALNIEICDMINDTDEGPRDAVKAIKRRLHQNAGKNYTSVMYTLTVLETCVKNCGKRFHLLITSKDFVQELIKLIGPKNDPPTAVQEKVLSLIQNWADAFKNNPEMQGVGQVYTDLRQKGIEFPMTNLDTMAPIHTPQKRLGGMGSGPPASASPVPTQSNLPPSGEALQQPPHHHHHHVSHTLPKQKPTAAAVPVPQGPIMLSPEQLAKLRGELDLVQGNMHIFGDMLAELVPGNEHASDLELLRELYKTCRAMQSRIVELIDRVATEEVTNELLRINDEMNNLFLRYERYDKKRSHMASGDYPLPEKKPVPDSSPLIDFGEDPADSASAQLAGLAIGGAPPLAAATASGDSKGATAKDDEFDMFAQSRNVTYDQNKSGSTYKDNTNLDQVDISLGALAHQRGVRPVLGGKEQEFEEMEKWLHDQQTANQAAQGGQTISSSEFDTFLAERAAASGKSPPKQNNTPADQSVRPRRPLEASEEKDSLFTL